MTIRAPATAMAHPLHALIASKPYKSCLLTNTNRYYTTFNLVNNKFIRHRLLIYTPIFYNVKSKAHLVGKNRSTQLR